MGMKIKYVGPKDFKTFKGQRFYRLLPVEVSNTIAAEMLAFPDVFLPGEQEVPEDVLAQRYALPDAMVREAEARIEDYTMMMAQARLMPNGQVDEKSGKPDSKMQKRLDAMAGAQSEIDFAKAQIKSAELLRRQIESEKALAAAEPDDEKPKRGRKADLIEA